MARLSEYLPKPVVPKRREIGEFVVFLVMIETAIMSFYSSILFIGFHEFWNEDMANYSVQYSVGDIIFAYMLRPVVFFVLALLEELTSRRIFILVALAANFALLVFVYMKALRFRKDFDDFMYMVLALHFPSLVFECLLMTLMLVAPGEPSTTSRFVPIRTGQESFNRASKMLSNAMNYVTTFHLHFYRASMTSLLVTDMASSDEKKLLRRKLGIKVGTSFNFIVVRRSSMCVLFFWSLAAVYFTVFMVRSSYLDYIEVATMAQQSSYMLSKGGPNYLRYSNISNMGSQAFGALQWRGRLQDCLLECERTENCIGVVRPSKYDDITEGECLPKGRYLGRLEDLDFNVHSDAMKCGNGDYTGFIIQSVQTGCGVSGIPLQEDPSLRPQQDIIATVSTFDNRDQARTGCQKVGAGDTRSLCTESQLNELQHERPSFGSVPSTGQGDQESCLVGWFELSAQERASSAETYAARGLVARVCPLWKANCLNNPDFAIQLQGRTNLTCASQSLQTHHCVGEAALVQFGSIEVQTLVNENCLQSCWGDDRCWPDTHPSPSPVSAPSNDLSECHSVSPQYTDEWCRTVQCAQGYADYCSSTFPPSPAFPSRSPSHSPTDSPFTLAPSAPTPAPSRLRDIYRIPADKPQAALCCPIPTEPETFANYSIRIVELGQARVTKESKLVEVGLEVAQLVLTVLSALCNVLAQKNWYNYWRSRRYIALGWGLTFLSPLLLSAVPVREWMDWTKADPIARDYVSEFRNYFSVEKYELQAIKACDTAMDYNTKCGPDSGISPECTGFSMARLELQMRDMCDTVDVWVPDRDFSMPWIDVKLDLTKVHDACEVVNQMLDDGYHKAAANTMVDTCVTLKHFIQTGEARTEQQKALASDMGDVVALQVERAKFTAELAVASVRALISFKTMLPAAMSLAPGMIRGCLRFKILIPQSTIPGMFVVLLPALYCPMVWCVYNALFQFAGSISLLLGCFILAFASMAYTVIGIREGITRPMGTAQMLSLYNKMSNVTMVIQLVGAVLLLAYFRGLYNDENTHGVASDVIMTLMENPVGLILQLTVFTLNKFYYTSVAGIDWQMVEVANQRKYELQLLEEEKRISTSNSSNRAYAAKRIREKRLDDLLVAVQFRSDVALNRPPTPQTTEIDTLDFDNEIWASTHDEL